jgi:hypothetical protein
MRQLEQNAVGITMHDALDRRMRVVADRIGKFLGTRLEFGGVRNKLPGDRVMWIVAVYQRSQRRRQSHRVTPRNRVERGQLLGRCQTLLDQLRGRAKRARCRHTSFLSVC